MDEVLAGRKTQTRRERYLGDRLRMRNGATSVVRRDGSIRWTVGKSYSIARGRGIKGEPGVRIFVRGLGVDRAPLKISESNARAEGFGNSAEFRTAWKSLYPGTASMPCWVIVFKLIKLTAEAKP
jgi:hypothetical protein